MGIGLATALAFARQGARLVLTNKWGTADESEIRTRFERENLPPPQIIAADVSQDDDTTALLEDLRKEFSAIELFVSNVSMAMSNRRYGKCRNLNSPIRRR